MSMILAGGRRTSVRTGRRIASVQRKMSSSLDKDRPATLVLADGSRFEGVSFGADVAKSGETVFNTGMVGYTENLTDPSYKGQILVLTYPLVGNYGVPSRTVKDKYGLPKGFESDQIHVQGLVVADYSHVHSHWEADSSLGAWLKEEGIPAISGLDTRMLTQKLRDGGSQLGAIEFPGQAGLPLDASQDPNLRNLVAECSVKQPVVYNKGAAHRVMVVDCGMKHNMIRCFVERGAEVTVVPWDHDFTDMSQWDGLFISNGPGDPAQCAKTVAHLKQVIDVTEKPVFGICMGNQLISLAAGAQTYKMEFGNRGQNIPVKNVLTGECVITPQNHGYAVDPSTMTDDWRQLFYNANDGTNEGIINVHRPVFSAQFHPEHRGGPDDTEYFFDVFMDMVRNPTARPKLWTGKNFPPPKATGRVMLPPPVPKVTEIKKVLMLGSGGLSIGQAGEFDYSGAQAIKALKEEGVEVVLMNPNIASVQTNVDKSTNMQADQVYSVPVTFDFVKGVIKKERPDAILISMGGQTALNTGVELDDAGIFKQFGVKVLGTSIESVKWTEDRQLFSDKLHEINEKIAESYTATDIPTAAQHAEKIGYPVMIRSAFALGGLGSGICESPEILQDMAAKALSVSPQILVERSMVGWKEVEYEVVRDVYDNCVTVCNMENFDPLGVHTGDSIVIAPSQTLNNDEYHMLRNTALSVVRHLGIVGECNIQYALNPHSKDYCIIEVNPRLSRSSALASKATGYPLAFVAAKLALNQPLPDLRNAVTKTTTANFEPSLDYVVTKIPRWDLKKFQNVNRVIGSAMKSVGEVMAVGRTFEESMQKAMRMVDPGNVEGFETQGTEHWTQAMIDEELVKPTDMRTFAIARCLYNREISWEEIHSRTKIDRWFLAKLQNIADMHFKLQTADGDIGAVDVRTMRRAKQLGFSDRQIAMRMDEGTDETVVRAARKQHGIVPVVKQIDTQAAEYPASTNYLYMTYNGITDDIEFNDKGTMVLGCGAYRIGSSVEFDWCAVSAIRALRQMGKKSIVVNYNPETVSTDYDECDRLYFEELSRERVLDIYEKEQSEGVIVSVGGQIPNSLALEMEEDNINVLGTKPADIDNAEDRDKFSALMDSVGVDQPAWSALSTMDEATTWCQDRYPVLIRPSYVLSGAAMKVARNPDQLLTFLANAAEVSQDKPVVITEFIDGCYEVEVDGVAKDGEIICHAVAEHVENAGVHSGDATHVLPPQELSNFQIMRVRQDAAKVAKALNITGPFNVQFLAKGADIKCIECNLRASRSVPFVSKTVGTDFINVATRAMVGAEQVDDDLPTLDKPPRPSTYVGVKVPMFSFTRLRGADPQLGVEMASTGEVACFGKTKEEAFMKGLLATRFELPEKNSSILVSIQEEFRHDFVHSAYNLTQLGYKIYATDHTHAFLQKHNVPSTHAPWPGMGDDCCESLIRDNKIDVVINLPNENTNYVKENYVVRRAAVDFDTPLLNNAVTAKLFIKGLEQHHETPMVGVDPTNLFEHYTGEDSDHKWARTTEKATGGGSRDISRNPSVRW